MFKKAKNQHIEDYPKFDPYRHTYAVATGFGDGWIAYPPISSVIADDLANILDNVPMPDEEHAKLCLIDWKDWIELLSVYEGDIEIASFNLKTWEWETL